MLELAFEIILYIGWSFPVWLGSTAVYLLTFGQVRCHDETLAGCIGSAILISLMIAGVIVFR